MSTCFTTVLLICCAPFVAQENSVAPPPTPMSAAHHRYHQASTPEAVALRMLVRHLVLQRYDANHDGRLDRAERESLRHETREALHQQAAAVAARFDRNQDGKLSPEEMEEMRRSFRPRGKRHAGPPCSDTKQPENCDCARREHARKDEPHRPHRKHRRMGRFAREMAYVSHKLTLQAYDADGSGQLDEQEMNTCRQDAAKLYEKRKGELLLRFDTDKNGQLSEAEFHEARAQLLPRPTEEKKRHRPSPVTVDDMAILRIQLHSPCSPSTN